MQKDITFSDIPEVNPITAEGEESSLHWFRAIKGGEVPQLLISFEDKSGAAILEKQDGDLVEIGKVKSLSDSDICLATSEGLIVLRRPQLPDGAEHPADDWESELTAIGTENGIKVAGIFLANEKDSGDEPNPFLAIEDSEGISIHEVLEDNARCRGTVVAVSGNDIAAKQSSGSHVLYRIKARRLQPEHLQSESGEPPPGSF